jgi:hypothetical protein
MCSGPKVPKIIAECHKDQDNAPTEAQLHIKPGYRAENEPSPLLDTRLEGQQLTTHGSTVLKPRYARDAAAEVALQDLSGAVDGAECAQEDPAGTGQTGRGCEGCWDY